MSRITKYMLAIKKKNINMIHISLINILLDLIGLNKNDNDDVDNISKEAFLNFFSATSLLFLLIKHIFLTFSKLLIFFIKRMYYFYYYKF